MSDSPTPQQPTVGILSMWFGIIASSALFFGIGLYAVSGLNQTWYLLVGGALALCGASSALLGLLAMILGFAGFFSKGNFPTTAFVGLFLGFIGFCSFAVVLNIIGSGR